MRPTMDMVRGAIFSMLGESVVEARVLDLFAGTGALGIEALSRGAATAVLVEKSAKAVVTINENLAKTRLQATVVTADIFRYLDHLAGAGEAFDLIFADPPYAKYPGDRDFTPELLASASLQRLLKPEGTFVLEHLPGATLPVGTGWECVRQKAYGATEVAMLRKK